MSAISVDCRWDAETGFASVPMRLAIGGGGTFLVALLLCAQRMQTRRPIVGGLIYLIGLIVVVLFILSFLGLR
jgi:hypothetical protein